MSVKGYLALLVGVFVAALAVVTVTLRSAGAGGRPGLLVPALVTLVAVALAALLIRLILREIARPIHSAGANIRSNPAAFQDVLDRVTVQETGFFRHPDQFAALVREVLPALEGPVVV